MKPVRSIAIVFAFVLGAIGFQHFYVRRNAIGVLSFLFCWTLIPLFFGIWQGWKWLKMNDGEFEVLYP